MVVKVKLVIMCLTGLCANLGFSAESISIAATPRYPWNGKVDLKFTIDGTSGTKYDTSFTAKDVAGGTNLTMKTLYKSNGTAANVAKEQLLPGTYNWVWDATADLGEGTVLEKVVVEGKAVAYEPLYMVIDLSGGSSAKSYPVSYLDAVPSGGWGNAYKGKKLGIWKIDRSFGWHPLMSANAIPGRSDGSVDPQRSWCKLLPTDDALNARLVGKEVHLGRCHNSLRSVFE